MTVRRRVPGRGAVSLPSVVFVLAFVLLGWTAGHSIAYEVVGLGSHDHGGHHDPMHAYFGGLKLAGGVGLVVAFGLALRSFSRNGSFGEWLHEGGASGTRRQITLATALPASVFVLAEYFERLAAGTAPPVRLLLVGVLVQTLVGLLCLALARLAFRVAERVIRSFSDLARRPSRSQAAVPSAPEVALARPSCPMAGSAAGRAPPRPIALR